MKALIAMSGGVDSSMAAKLTIEKGIECIGCTMKLFENEDADPDNVEDARNVASRFDMPFYVFDLRDEFQNCVMEKFVQFYAEGKTPNPCIDCNRHLKFGELLQKAEELGCDYIVTGHYGRIEHDESTGKYILKKGADPAKDQSYVLHRLTQKQLAHILMPLGEYTKTEIRAMAEKAGFANANKPDSEDICFIPDGDYAAMIERFLGKEFPPGEFVDTKGNVIGQHRGIIHYTVGQRKHLGQTFGEPRYVCRVDAENNRVVLGTAEEVFSEKATVTEFNWISGEVPKEDVRCTVRTRYQQKEKPATVRVLSDETVEIIFDEPQRAVTPGQAAVLYDGDIVLGGGTII